MTEINKQADKSSNFFGQIVDGASVQYGLKKRGFETLTERLAGFASVVIPTIALNDRFRIKPALNTLSAVQKEAVVNKVPLGRLTIGK